MDGNDYKYEYTTTPLTGLSSRHISIPASIILDNSLDAKRVGVFSYLRIRCGLDDVVHFTVHDMIKWCGNKPEKGSKGMNGKFLNIIDVLSGRGYLTYLAEQNKSTCMQCAFDMDYYKKECKNNGFALIYLDEIEKIMNYKKENVKDAFLTNTAMLLVFTYLRYKINRRPNELRPEDRSIEGINNRKLVFPDAYADNISNIADELGISAKTISKIIDILECNLGLIVTDRAYRIKNEDDEYRTPYTIFANAYKREGKCLLNTESNYSRIETENKSKLLDKYYGNYKINKGIRKNVLIE